MSIVRSVGPVRRRKQVETMRRAQRVALDLFEAKGFDAVTVADVADAVGVAASTIYRHFSTKEALVLWDEHAPAIDRSLDRHLRSKRPPLESIRIALIESLGARYDEADSHQLRRVRYVYATEQLHAAAVEEDMRNRDELADGLAQLLPKKRRASARIVAGVAMVALDVAMDRWQSAGGEISLSACIDEAFDQLGDVTS